MYAKLIDVMARCVPTYETHPALAVAEMTRALAALQSAGYAVVPVEPTEEMTKAAIDADDKRTGAETCKHIYRAMIEATKNPPQREPERAEGD